MRRAGGIRGRGTVVAISVLVVLGGCREAPLGERDDLADAIAERAGATELASLQELKAQREEYAAEELHDGIHEELGDVMADPEPPEGVAELRPAPGWQSHQGEGLLQVARAMAVLPEDGEPFCVVVGLGSHDAAAGARADGDVAEDCEDAVIPRQREGAHEGNPLDLAPQTDKLL